MPNIKNIIFDLGAVLLNLDMLKTDAAFEALVGDKKTHEWIRQKLYDRALFSKFETNEILELEFVQTIKSFNPSPLNDEQINQAWSAMLLDFPLERIELLKKLKEKGYRLFLLSNINSIHLRDVYTIIQKEHGNLDFDALFDKAYYSHLIGRRKPDPATYQFVLNDAGIKAAETLFIDDNADNIEGAASTGIRAVHHIANGDIIGLIEKELNIKL
jgi:putative hydrolase of the HAD superfamily